MCRTLLPACTGEVVTQRVSILNNGNVGLRDLTFTPSGSPLNHSCSTLQGYFLEVDGVLGCEVTYLISQANIEQGSIMYSAEVAAAASAGAPAAANGFIQGAQLTTVTATSSPSLSVTIETSMCNQLQSAGESQANAADLIALMICALSRAPLVSQRTTAKCFLLSLSLVS